MERLEKIYYMEGYRDALRDTTEKIRKMKKDKTNKEVKRKMKISKESWKVILEAEEAIRKVRANIKKAEVLFFT